MRVFLLFSRCFRRESVFFLLHVSNLDVRSNELAKETHSHRDRHRDTQIHNCVCSGTLCLLAVAKEFWIILYKINAIVDKYVFVRIREWRRLEKTIQRERNNERVELHCAASQHSNCTNRRHCAALHTQLKLTAQTPSIHSNVPVLQVQIHKCNASAYSINTQSNKMHN